MDIFVTFIIWILVLACFLLFQECLLFLYEVDYGFIQGNWPTPIGVDNFYSADALVVYGPHVTVFQVNIIQRLA